MPPHVCEHLRALEDHLIAQGHKITHAGKVWSLSCRCWIYFDAHFDWDDLKKRFASDPCVEMHQNDDPKSGTEKGLVCNVDHDGIMGYL